MAESVQLQKLSPKHENILNYIIANPLVSYGEVAGYFGVTPSWLSTIVHSDVFQDLLKRRQDEVFGTAIVQDLKTKLTAAADMSLERYLEKIPTMDADQIITSTDKLLGKLGFGSKPYGPSGGVVNNYVQNNYVDQRTIDDARRLIGENSALGEADFSTSLPPDTAEERSEEKGLAVRANGA